MSDGKLAASIIIISAIMIILPLMNDEIPLLPNLIVSSVLIVGTLAAIFTRKNEEKQDRVIDFFGNLINWIWGLALLIGFVFLIVSELFR